MGRPAIKVEDRWGRPIGIWFEYDRSYNPPVIVTKIYFLEPDGEIIQNYPPYEGIAFTHPDDNFCKETGRKISLSRAMKNDYFNKGLRKRIWKEYFKLTNNQKLLRFF